MTRPALPRRALALFAAAALHVLLAIVVVSRIAAPQPPEAPAIQVTLVDLPPRTPKPPRPPPPQPAPPPSAAPASALAQTQSPREPARDGGPAPNWRVDTTEPADAQGARATLRAHVGCRTADLLALTKAERAACQEALAKGAETAPTYAVISPKLRKVFDGTFECPKGDVWCEYRIGKAPYPGLFAPRKKPRDKTWDQ